MEPDKTRAGRVAAGAKKQTSWRCSSRRRSEGDTVPGTATRVNLGKGVCWRVGLVVVALIALHRLMRPDAATVDAEPRPSAPRPAKAC